MRKIKYHILIIGILSLISINANAGWAKHRDKILKGFKNWINSNDQRHSNNRYKNDNSPNKTNTNNSVSNTNTYTNNSLNFEMEVVRLINIERTKRGIHPLSISNKLFAAAAIRASELTQKFSHTRPNGSSYLTAVQNVGYPSSYVGENIAAGQISPIAVMESWMNSPGHRANILNPNYTEIGVGVNYEDGYYGISWVQLFGKLSDNN
jgi:SCP-like extracellular